MRQILDKYRWKHDKVNWNNIATQNSSKEVKSLVWDMLSK